VSTRAVQYGGVSPLAVSRLLSVLLRFLGFFRCLRSDGVSCHVVSVSVLSRVAFRVFDRSDFLWRFGV
jgi:hypothetical protein